MAADCDAPSGCKHLGAENDLLHGLLFNRSEIGSVFIAQKPYNSDDIIKTQLRDRPLVAGWCSGQAYGTGVCILKCSILKQILGFSDLLRYRRGQDIMIDSCGSYESESRGKCFLDFVQRVIIDW